MTLPTGRLNSYDCVVTGASGFLGRHLIRKLLAEEANVVAIDRSSNVSKIVNEFPDPEKSFCFHLAGMSRVSLCDSNPAMAYHSNVATTATMLEFCQQKNIGTFIFPSSGLVYGTSLEHPATEREVVPPKNMYATTKLAAETIIRGYQATNALRGIIVRLANVYGPNANPEAVIGQMLFQAQRREKLKLRDMTEVRDFIYVDDVIEAMIRLSLLPPESETVCANVSTGIGHSIRHVAETLTQIAKLPPLDEPLANEGPSSYSVLDNSKLIEKTSWSPEHTLSDGLALTFFKK